MRSSPLRRADGLPAAPCTTTTWLRSCPGRSRLGTARRRVFSTAAILSVAFQNAGIPDPIPNLDMFGSGPITLALRYWAARVELNKRVHPESNGEPHWWDLETGQAQIDPVVGLFTTPAPCLPPSGSARCSRAPVTTRAFASMVPSHPSSRRLATGARSPSLDYLTFEDPFQIAARASVA